MWGSKISIIPGPSALLGWNAKPSGPNKGLTLVPLPNPPWAKSVACLVHQSWRASAWILHVKENRETKRFPRRRKHPRKIQARKTSFWMLCWQFRVKLVFWLMSFMSMLPKAIPWGDDESQESESDQVDPAKLRKEETEKVARKRAGIPDLDLDALPSTGCTKMMNLCPKHYTEFIHL